jgi:hypothetical protein
MRLIMALLSLGIGAALVLMGYRFARALLPLMGFVLGLSFGGAIIADLAGTVFLGTALGIFVGIISGLILGVLAYFYYYMAVAIAAVSLGYWAGSSLILLLGFSPGFLSALAGVGLGALVGVLAVIVNLPRYVLITVTSLAGAVTAVGGTLLLFHKIPLDAYSYTTTKIALSNSFFWTVITLVLFGMGILVQLATTTDYELDEWNAGEHSPTPPNVLTHGVN